MNGIPASLADLAVPVENLKPYGRNARRGDIEAIAESLSHHGQYRPVVVNSRTNEVLAGNHTLKAAQSLGWTHVAATWVDADDDQAARIVLVDNKANDAAGYDDTLLVELLSDLPDFAGTGWSQDELDELLTSVTELPPALADPDDVPETPVEPRSKLGDVWVLGEHRLICGDSTDVGVYDELLGEEKVHMVWTDPPYGVAYVGKTADALTIENDTMDLDGLTDFLRESLGAAYAACLPGAMWFVAAPHLPISHAFGTTLLELGVWRHTLIWVKDRFALGRGDYHYRHEALYYGWRPDGPRLAPLEDRTQDTVWEFDKPSRNGEHPTMKPVGLIAKAIENASRRRDLVLDCFGGSGSTLIAAQQTGRRARLIELDPRYVDVICRRYQEATGTKPVLESTGEPHDFTQ